VKPGASLIFTDASIAKYYYNYVVVPSNKVANNIVSVCKS